MKQGRQRIRYLVTQYLEGSLSGMEEAEFWGYVEDVSFEPIVKQLLSEKFGSEAAHTALDEQAQARILDRIYLQGAPRVRSRRLKWLPYAAAAILIAATGVGLFLSSRLNQPEAQITQLPVEDVQPGGNRAVLTLADGRKIALNEDQSGIVLAGAEITYQDGVSLANLDTENPSEGSVQWLELTTPKGGTYQVTLPDGTDVWLNAGSVLRYPIQFDRKQREVELSGEAYFDVAQLRVKNRKVPFLVKTKGQTVEVLGTQFNLSAYAEDGNVKTTLVEGRVRVASVEDGYMPVVLKPGEQSVVEDGKVAVSAVDVRPFIAWKDGYFHFKSTPFPDVIKQLARWYDIDLTYHTNVPKQTFSGKMSRNVSLQNVLRFFEGSGVEVTLTDNKLIIE